jgi:putative lipoic acid-binding regulatory protein
MLQQFIQPNVVSLHQVLLNMTNKPIFDGLRAKLVNEEWPSSYLFKFILPNESEKIAKLLHIFGTDNKQDIKPSSKGNYVSVSIQEMMMSADEVMEKYEKASEIKGVMSL